MEEFINTIYITKDTSPIPIMIKKYNKDGIDITINVQLIGLKPGKHKLIIDAKNNKNESIMTKNKPNIFNFNLSDVSSKQVEGKYNFISIFGLAFSATYEDLNELPYIKFEIQLDENKEKKDLVLFLEKEVE